ncbi:MAG: HAD-IC family P-type ATPase, partial [Gammaproteobacteria bacterium]|nr:HAD-IC family P-type ATPase [Gammaproteobacteria bacterium]
MSATSNASEPAWHCLAAAEVVARLRTDPLRGLSTRAATDRLEDYGPNALAEGRQRGLVAIFLGQFADFMILVLLAAALLSGFIGEPMDTLAILVILLLNAAIGAAQEFRAERAVAALRRMAALRASVVRDGRHQSIDAAELVPGDLVILETGNQIPADLRLLEVNGLQIDESTLTGESSTVAKSSEALTDAELLVADRSNLAFKGTSVTHGRGLGLVVTTGMQTELGRVGRLLATEKGVKTPLQIRLARFGRYLALAVLAVCAVVFATGLLQGQPPMLMALTALSLAVAAIPEALPAVITVSLALGARKLSRHQTLVRNLPAVETLGSVTVICSDKTGTLTRNLMHCERVLADGVASPTLRSADAGSPWRDLGQALALCNDVVPGDGESEAVGEPTELALYQAAERAGYAKSEIETALPRVAEIPFDSRRKLMTTLHRETDGVVAYVKGAPEVLLQRCEYRLASAGRQAVDAAAVCEAARELAEQGYRVLAVAQRRFDERPVLPDEMERQLTLLGMVALIDPPRPEAAAAVAECRGAGITPVMITGDHPGTARAIAMRLGMADEAAEVLTGRELAALSDTELERRIATTRVYARVSPEQKIRIVKALQAGGEFVAMTGDGVNDAPALKRAGIGIAMGGKGTDVAREAADMVLLDDDFATIVRAVREGRRIFDNIRKFVK